MTLHRNSVLNPWDFRDFLVRKKSQVYDWKASFCSLKLFSFNSKGRTSFTSNNNKPTFFSLWSLLSTYLTLKVLCFIRNLQGLNYVFSLPLHLLSLLQKTTFETVQKWSSKPFLDSPNMVMINYFPIVLCGRVTLYRKAGTRLSEVFWYDV